MPERPSDADDSDLRELRALAAGRSPREVQWEEPPEGMWERIDVAAHAATEPSAESSPEHSADVVDLTSTSERRGSHRSGTPPAARRSNGSRRAPWLLAAAAALLVVGAVGWLLRDASGPDVVATTELEPLGDSGRGTAELVDVDGTMQLRLDTEGLDPGDGFAEVWVIDTDVSKLVSLGPLREDGVYDLPPGLDPGQFPVVDVSYEPLDGDPAHSGDSVLRGTLEL